MHDGSKLGIARQRFLSDVIEHALSSGRRSPADFLRHFPPLAIMRALVGQPDLRARILFATVGTRTPVGERKSPAAAAEDLEIALEVGETDAETLVTLLGPDDRVRYLEESALWAFVTEGELWNATGGIELDIARAHVSYILERALAEELIDGKELIDAIGVDPLARALPREQLVRLLSAALEHGRDERPFREADLLAVMPVETLAEHVPLPLLWERVVVRRIADPRGLSSAAGTPRPRAVAAALRPPRAPSIPRMSGPFDDESTNDVIRGFLDAE